MKAWKTRYSKEELEKGRILSENLKVKQFDGVEIICEVDGFEVKAYLYFQTPTLLSCSCLKKYWCEHQAALIFFTQTHPELMKKEDEFNLNLIDKEELINFIEKELKENPDFERRFFEEFSKNPEISKKRYFARFDEILEYGRDENYGVYDIDLIAPSLHSFMDNEIAELLNIGEHDSACKLLTGIAKILNDELASTYDSWYNLADSFINYENILCDSIIVSERQLDELESNVNLIHEFY